MGLQETWETELADLDVPEDASEGVNYYPPSQPLKYYMEGSEYCPVQTSQAEIQTLGRLASWEITPPFSKPDINNYPTRGTVIPLRKIDRGIYAYHSKGLGSRHNDEVRPPNLDEAFVPLGGRGGMYPEYDRNGTYKPRPTGEEPLGGCLADKCQDEFKNTLRVHEAGIPTTIPLRYGTYEDREWQGKDTGFLILGHPVKETRRLGRFLQDITPDGDLLTLLREKYRINRDAGLFDLSTALLRFEADIKARIALRIKNIQNKAGLTRFQAHLGNLTYDKATDTLVSHDFERAIPISSIPKAAQGCYKLEDFHGVVKQILQGLIDHPLTFVLPESRQRPLIKKLFEDVLRGYFIDSEDDEDAINLLDESVDVMFDLLLKARNAHEADIEQIELKYGIEIELYPILLRLYQASNHQTTHPIHKTVEQALEERRNALDDGSERENPLNIAGAQTTTRASTRNLLTTVMGLMDQAIQSAPKPRETTLTKAIGPEYRDLFDIPDQPSVAYHMPARPLDFELHGADEGGLPVPWPELKLIGQMCGWNVPPVFTPTLKQGTAKRSAKLTRLRTLELGDKKVFAYQLKGVGSRVDEDVCPPAPETEYVTPLGQEINNNESLETSINDDGTYHVEVREVQGMGVCLAADCKREFECLVFLDSNGIPVPSAVRWGIYEGLQHSNEQAGFLILAGNVKEEGRLGTIITEFEDEGELSPRLEAILGSVDLPESASAEEKAIAMVNFLMGMNKRIGRRLQKIHALGMVDFQSHKGNVSFDLESDTLVSHDFETARKLDEVPSQIRGLTKFYDIERTVVSELYMLVDPKYLNYLPEGDIGLACFNMISSLLVGYFYEEGETRNDKLEPLCINAAKDLTNLISDGIRVLDSNENFQGMVRLFQSEVPRILIPLYRGSHHQGVHPIHLSAEEVCQNRKIAQMQLQLRESGINASRDAAIWELIIIGELDGVPNSPQQKTIFSEAYRQQRDQLEAIRKRAKEVAERFRKKRR